MFGPPNYGRLVLANQRTAGGVVMRFYPALMILVTVTVAGWGVGMYVHAFLLPK
jgi:hypothetical protein